MIYTRPQRGYTLLEMIVSIGLFSIVMLVATAAYLTLINMDRQTRATSDLMTNLSFAVDSMSRSIRTGTDYCSSGCDSNTFSFIDSEGRDIVYDFNGGVITRKIDGASALAITDPRIIISATDGLRFYVYGDAVGAADGQPRVTFTIKGTVQQPSNAPVEFVIQSGATQRAIDI